MKHKYLIATALLLVFAFLAWACAPSGETKPPTEKKAETVKPPEPAPIKEEIVAKDPYASVREGFEKFKLASLAGSLNDKSCQTCHPYGGRDRNPEAMAKGTLIGKAATFPKVVDMVGKDAIPLTAMINYCIANPLEGTVLAEDDPALIALVEFHNALVPMTYEINALPIINKSCTDCHTGDAPRSINLSDMDTAVKNAEKVRMMVESGRMPRGANLDDMSYMTLIIWATNELDKL